MAESADIKTQIKKLKGEKKVDKSTLSKLRSKLAMFSLDPDSEKDILKVCNDITIVRDKVVETLDALEQAYEAENDQNNQKNAEMESEQLFNDIEKDLNSARQLLLSRAQARVVPSLDISANKQSSPKKLQRSDDTHSPELSRKPRNNLERIKVPIFDGNKLTFDSYWTAFMQVVDATDEDTANKMLRLKNSVKGKAAEAIKGLGYTHEEYEAAKALLIQKFGGERRKLKSYLDALEKTDKPAVNDIDQLELLSDNLIVAVAKLKAAKRDEDLSDGAWYSIVARKIPETLLVLYYEHIQLQEIKEGLDSLSEWFADIVNRKIRARESVRGLQGLSSPDKPSDKKPSFYKPTGRRTFLLRNDKCPLCGRNHSVEKCPLFRDQSIDERWDTAKKFRLCFRCLLPDHRGDDCNVSKECGVDGCKLTHHPMLHRKRKLPSDHAKDDVDAEEESTVKPIPKKRTKLTSRTFTVDSSQTLIGMRTIPIYIGDGINRERVVVLIDDCSDISYISSEAASALNNLETEIEPLTVKVFDGSEIKTESKVCDVIISKYNDPENELSTQKFYIVDNICDGMYAISWRNLRSEWDHLKGIPFPDLGTDTKVEGILGKDCRHLFYSVKEICGPNKSDPIARLCPLGWTCLGDDLNSPNKKTNVVHRTLFVNSNREDEEVSLNDSLKDFWRIEQSGTEDCKVIMSSTETKAVEKLQNSLSFDGNRYSVDVPWVDERPSLKNNVSASLKQLNQLHTRLKREPELLKAYVEWLNDYKEKSYISYVGCIDDVSESEDAWYWPHFPVVRPERETTKVRIVFNGSSKYAGTCPNSQAYSGPKLQADIFDVLVPFRSGLVALGADLSQMYLQVGMTPDDRKYHRFLWKPTPDSKVEVYEFTRFLFGGTYSPFCAMYVYTNHAKNNASEFPLAAEAVDSKTYMDDTICSVDTAEVAIETRRQLSSLADKGGFHYRKWISNDQSVLEDVPEVDRARVQENSLPKTKVLGVFWKADTDSFEYKVNVPDCIQAVTKREVLSQISRIYDPLGLISPKVVMAKFILQNTWLFGLDWDEPLTEKLQKEWKTWCIDLANLHDVQVPRCLKSTSEVKSIAIHTFCDASVKAYCSAVYQRTEYNDGSVSVRLIAAKTKLAPTNYTSMPKLELMAAELGTKLTKRICSILKLDIREATFWSDSYDVLFWLRGESRSYKTFVANRVGKIHEVTSPVQWRYVPTKKNPADTGTRGSNVDKLIHETQWWEGPEFLLNGSETWPETVIQVSSKAVDEVRKDWKDYVSKQKVDIPFDEKVRIYMIKNPTPIADENVQPHDKPAVKEDKPWRLDPSRWSKWLPVKEGGLSTTGKFSLVRTFAWVTRFIENCRSQNKTFSKSLTPDEIEKASMSIIKIDQRKSFSDDITALEKKKNVLLSSKLASLNPFLDEQGVLRSRTRLENSSVLSDEMKYPIILDKSCRVTSLLVVQEHDDTAHSVGPVQILNTLRQKYLIMRGSTLVKNIVENCAYCLRWMKKRQLSQQMAPLPKYRVNPSWHVFSEVGLDFGGPFVVKVGRGRARAKRYLLLFVDLQVRAVHLEATDSLDTDSFLSGFSRFAARRSWPSRCVSDNGGSFVSGEAEIRELTELLDQFDQTKIANNLANAGVKWVWNPPASPHFGGVFEVMIKAAKRSIKAILSGQEVNDEQFRTIVTIVEGLMNSRPLVGQDDSEPMITPNHFIIGRNSVDTAPSSVDLTPFNLRNRWRQCHDIVRQFWDRWILEILPQLSSRRKWYAPNQNISVGEVVVIIDKDVPRRQWKLGKIEAVYPGKDDLIRVVDVKTAGKVYRRSIGNISPLEFNCVKKD